MRSLKLAMLAQMVMGIGFFAVSGCENVAPLEEQQDDTPHLSLEDQLLHAFGSKDGVAVIRNAESVHAYRLAPENQYAKSFDDYEMTSEAIPLPAEIAERIQTCLLNNQHYLGGEKGCRPDYGVRIQFLYGDRSVDVLLCFFCKILMTYRDSNLVGGGHFDTIEGELLDSVKELFPQDEKIQELNSAAQSHAENPQ